MSKKISNAIRAHKIITTVVVILIIVGGYYWYHSATSTSNIPQYTISKVRPGTITQTVTGTGQVSAENQLDVKSSVSGTITSIVVKVGDHVHTGDLLATIDPTQAKLSLENSRLSFQKLTQAPKATDLSNAQNSVTQSYSTAFNSISNTFIDLQTVMPGVNNMLYGKNQFLSQQAATDLTTTAQDYRNQMGTNYDKANNTYNKLLLEYKNLNRNSATSTISQVLSDTHDLASQVSNALQGGQSTVNFIITTQSDYLPSQSAGAQSNISSWVNTINSDLSSLTSAQNSVASSENTLTNLITGADPLDVQAAKLSLQQQEQYYANYFIKAPFDGIVGRIPVNLYDQASGSSVIATIVGDNKIATISLNEVDASKVTTGQPATITFDAISNLVATGTVSQVDLVGTVTQGVVSYGVKIAINTTDPGIKPGMSVNTTIITKQLSDVIVVPTSAIKTKNGTNYVETFSLASSTQGFASTTRNFASSTRALPSGVSTSRTITTNSLPTQVTVTIGEADSTNTQIVSGLSGGENVVTRTINASASAATASAPSLLSSLSGGRGGAGGGATRAIGGAAGRPGN